MLTELPRRQGMRYRHWVLAYDMRAMGYAWVEIADAFRELHGVNALTAMRLAHGWSQRDVAERWTARWPDEPKTFKSISYWETWRLGAGHKPDLVVMDRLREKDCHLPATGWGTLTLERNRSQAGKRWTDSGDVHDDRGLMHRGDDEPRTVPSPPTLVAILRDHIDRYGVAMDGRLFGSERGNVVAASTYSRVWQEARALALTRLGWPLRSRASVRPASRGGLAVAQRRGSGA